MLLHNIEAVPLLNKISLDYITLHLSDAFIQSDLQ